MTLEASTQLQIYRDSLIEIHVPAQLNECTCDGAVYVFESSRSRHAKESISIYMMPSGDISGDIYYEQQHALMMQATFEDTKWERWTIVRAGQSSVHDGAIELITELKHLRHKTQEYLWQVLGRNDRYVYKIDMSGNGNFADDEPILERILKSFRIVGVTAEKSCAPKKRTIETRSAEVLGPVTEKQLASFPAEINYLVPMILHLARLPMEDLLDEDMDVCQLEAAVEGYLAGKDHAARKAIMKKHLAAIQRWSDGVERLDPKVETALSAVIGFIVGEYLYG